VERISPVVLAGSAAWIDWSGQPKRWLGGPAGAEQPQHPFNHPPYRRFFGCRVDRHDLPKAFEPTSRRYSPPAADKDRPRRQLRSADQAADGTIVIAR